MLFSVQAPFSNKKQTDITITNDEMEEIRLLAITGEGGCALSKNETKNNKTNNNKMKQRCLLAF